MASALALIPQPHRLVTKPARCAVRRSGVIAVSGHEFFPVARAATRLFLRHEIVVDLAGAPASLRIVRATNLEGEAYRLKIEPEGVTLEAASPSGAHAGLQTLLQIAAQSPARALPCLEIEDRPDFSDRGVYYDVCRGRVPTRESLLEQAGLLSRFKINQLQYYVEHTFRFRGHPLIGKEASPLTAEDVMALDEFCRARHIELVPSLASFGHMGNVLVLEPYRHLAEDLGVGRFVETADIPVWARHLRGWTLSPANPKTYEFLDSLFGEFLPCFSSERFNVCCDETWDLGCGQSHELCQKLGKGRVYLNHIQRLNDLCHKYGKRMMFWGDIIRHHPELIREIPRDVTVLDWGYGYNHPFDTVKDFTQTGLTTYVCPGTSGWVSLFPRVPESVANIAGFAAAGRRHGARGLLNTDWGDGGHANFMEYSWFGYLFGAEQAWNTEADVRSFPERFCRLFLKTKRPAVAKALVELGDVAQAGVDGLYQSVWPHLFFGRPGDEVFRKGRCKGALGREGRVVPSEITLDASFGRSVLPALARVRKAFQTAAREKGADPHGVLPYWIFAADTIAHAARRLAAFGAGGQDTPAVRRALRNEMLALRRRFEKLWMARNRSSEIRITLGRFAQALKA
jgi:hexosaminidase